MNKIASVSRVPPPPGAPKEAHDRHVEAVRAELEQEAEEAWQRRIDAARRAGIDVVEELEQLALLAAGADESSWREVRAAARAILARKAG
jgi:hypothetical protein